MRGHLAQMLNIRMMLTSWRLQEGERGGARLTDGLGNTILFLRLQNQHQEARITQIPAGFVAILGAEVWHGGGAQSQPLPFLPLPGACAKLKAAWRRKNESQSEGWRHQAQRRGRQSRFASSGCTDWGHVLSWPWEAADVRTGPHSCYLGLAHGIPDLKRSG